MTAQVYRRRTTVVRAFQWDGSDVHGLAKFAADDFDWSSDGHSVTYSVRTVPHSTWEVLEPGNWVIRDGDGLRRFTDDDFRAEFEPAATDHL